MNEEMAQAAREALSAYEEGQDMEEPMRALRGALEENGRRKRESYHEALGCAFDCWGKDFDRVSDEEIAAFLMKSYNLTDEGVTLDAVREARKALSGEYLFAIPSGETEPV